MKHAAIDAERTFTCKWPKEKRKQKFLYKLMDAIALNLIIFVSKIIYQQRQNQSLINKHQVFSLKMTQGLINKFVIQNAPS